MKDAPFDSPCLEGHFLWLNTSFYKGLQVVYILKGKEYKGTGIPHGM